MSQLDEKVDLRVSRTQNALQTALLTLLEKSPFTKITVHTICKSAGVSRATFYMHYQDKYALLRVCLERLWGEMDQEPGDQKELIRRVVALTHQHARLLKNVTYNDSNQELSQMLSESMVIAMIQQLKERKARGDRYPVPEEILARFISGGVAYLLIWWMMENCAIPLEEMTEHLTVLAEHLEALAIAPPMGEKVSKPDRVN